MRILTLLLCLATVCGYAQEDAIRQVVLENEQSAAAARKFFSDCPSEDSELAGEPAQALCTQSRSAEEDSVQAKRVFQTYGVRIALSGGFTFHVADYYDGTVVVTCLDGPLDGLQSVFINGVVHIESYDSAWYPNYFIHWYPGGVVYSYLNKQIMEVY